MLDVTPLVSVLFSPTLLTWFYLKTYLYACLAIDHHFPCHTPKGICNYILSLALATSLIISSHTLLENTLHASKIEVV